MGIICKMSRTLMDGSVVQEIPMIIVFILYLWRLGKRFIRLYWYDILVRKLVY